MAKTVLVTGATGFLGSHLTRRLVDSGFHVALLKRRSSSLVRIADLLDRLTAFDIDGVSLPEIFRQVGRIDAIVHTATSYGRRGETVPEVMRSNTLFGLELLEQAVAHGVSTFINTDTVLHGGLNAYAISKRHFAEWGRYYANIQRIGFVNVKLEHLYGPGDDSTKFVTHVVRQCLRNVTALPLTAGEQRRDFIHVSDAVTAYMTLLDRVEGKGWFEFEVGSATAIPIREFVELIARLTATSTLLEFGALPYRENEIMESRADTSALMALGWTCDIALESGLRLMIEEERSI